ncbi:unnamed protein product [Lymnaea stagnalis]|uniref:FYVE-type domain-containing protein n=1 Tax=Lymnaea stagnalis TaxID=6523 RepID=A0AAV2H279_LYMST
MPGQCYACGAEFGVFRKEHGCKNCGFAFCNKCLNEKGIPVPKRNNGKHHVCHNCFKTLTGPILFPLMNAIIFLPLTDSPRRMAALKERESQSHSSGRSSQSPNSGQKLPEHIRKLDKPDREIAMRLQKLKEADKPKEAVSDTDIQARLAQLKGQSVQPDKKVFYQAPDTRAEVQQVDDLLEQLSAEVKLDSLIPDPAEEVEARLRQYYTGDATAANRTSKADIDDNNLNKGDKSGRASNNLNTVEKLGPIGKPFNKNIEGAGSETALTGASARKEDTDLDDIQKLMTQAARDLELEAQRAIDGLQKDKELMDRLKVIQARQKERNKNVDDVVSVDSDTDNTTKTCDISRMTDVPNDDSDEESEEVATQKLIQRFMDETKIDATVGDLGGANGQRKPSSVENKKANKKEKMKESSKIETKKENSDSDYDDTDELPYCCMCTEDATLRCKDCDQDLYCQKCFKASHKEMDITDHRMTPYKAPKGYR